MISYAFNDFYTLHMQVGYNKIFLIRNHLYECEVSHFYKKFKVEFSRALMKFKSCLGPNWTQSNKLFLKRKYVNSIILVYIND